MSTIIGIKQLQRSLKKVADAAGRGETFTVVRDSKPVFRIEPILGRHGATKTFADFALASRFKGPRNLSRRIDDILYGSR